MYMYIPSLVHAFSGKSLVLYMYNYMYIHVHTCKSALDSIQIYNVLTTGEFMRVAI